MTIDTHWFYRQVGMTLGLAEADAPAAGAAFMVDGVECRTNHNDALSCVHVFMELGTPLPDSSAEVHALLLQTQVFFLGQIDAMFLKAPDSEQISFVARLPLPDDASPQRLAEAIRGLAAQVRSWQSTLLAGRLHDDEAEFEAVVAEMLGQVAEPSAVPAAA